MINLWKVLCFPETAVLVPGNQGPGMGGGGQTWGEALSTPPGALTYTLPTLWGGLEAGIAQTVEGALSVDTLASQTLVSDHTLVHI